MKNSLNKKKSIQNVRTIKELQALVLNEDQLKANHYSTITELVYLFEKKDETIRSDLGKVPFCFFVFLNRDILNI